MTSDVGSSHLLEFTFWALWVTVARVLRNTLSKDPKINWLTPTWVTIIPLNRFMGPVDENVTAK